MKRRNKGFTLIELIVVVAILVLLMLMLVPRLTGFTKTASVTICNANVANAYKLMVMEYSLHYEDFDKEDAERVIDENLGDHEKLCPLGGRIHVEVDQYNKSDFTVYCEEHGQSDQQKLANYSGDVLKMAVEEYYIKNFPYRDVLDSRGKNFGTPFKQKIAEKYNLDIGNFDFTIVKDIKSGSGFKVYIYDGIGDAKKGETITGVVYSYDANQNLIGAEKGENFTGTGSNKTTEGVTYNILDINSIQ